MATAGRVANRVLCGPIDLCVPTLPATSQLEANLYACHYDAKTRSSVCPLQSAGPIYIYRLLRHYFYYQLCLNFDLKPLVATFFRLDVAIGGRTNE